MIALFRSFLIMPLLATGLWLCFQLQWCCDDRKVWIWSRVYWVL